MIDQENHDHPSYCMVSFSRCHSSRPVEFVGSMVKSNSYIELRIKRAVQQRNVSKTWFFEKEPIVELRLSPNQFSELLTNMNSSGVPGTLEYVNGEGYAKGEHVPPPPRIEEIELHEQEIIEEIEKQKMILQELIDYAGTLKITKKEKEIFKSICWRLQNSVFSNIPFILKSVNNVIQKTVIDAKSCIDSFYQGILVKLGMKAIEKGMLPEILIDPTKEIKHNE